MSMPLLLGGGAALLASFCGALVGAAVLGLVVSATCGSLFCDSVLIRGREAAGLLGFAGGAVADAVCSASAGALACGAASWLDENRLLKKPVWVGALAAPVEPVELVSAAATLGDALFLLNRLPKKPLTPLLDGLLAAA